MENILIFGNPLIKIDNLILRILPELKRAFQKIKFIHLDPTENIEKYGPELTIIDVFHGIEKPLILDDLTKLKLPNVNSMHDFDLAYNLKLLMSVGKISSTRIFGLPYDINENNAINWLKKVIPSSQ